MGLVELAESSVNIVLRVWANASDAGSVRYKMDEEVYRAFASEGLNIPFPQMEVHVTQPSL